MQAGFGQGLITPKPPVHLAGFGGRTEPVTEVLDDLTARALYLSTDGVRFCLVVCDLLGMSPGYSRPVRERIAEATGIPLEGVLISCTHTHQGPSTIAGSEAIGWPPPDGYETILQQGCVDAAELAVQTAEDATVRYARAPLPEGFAFNRRDGDYSDPWFAVLDVVGRGGRIGLLANMHIHPVLLGPHWRSVSTDWVGPFRDRLEERFSVPAIQMTGALGDINPTPPNGEPGESYEPWASADDTRSYGASLANVVAGVVEGAEELEPTLRIARSETEEIAIGGTGLAALSGEASQTAEFIEWEIGDVRVVAIPGEGFHLLGKEISASRDDRVLLAGIAPSWLGYLPHPWAEGYEEGVSFGEDFVSRVKETLLTPPA